MAFPVALSIPEILCQRREVPWSNVIDEDRDLGGLFQVLLLSLPLATRCIIDRKAQTGQSLDAFF